MIKRTLHELNLLDDFLFNKVASYPEIGEEFGRELLRLIYQREFGKIKVVPQKVYYGSDVGKHGIRLDVYLEAEDAEALLQGQGSIFDIEPDTNDKKEAIQILPKRTRFYHAIIDANSLKAGLTYKCLKDVVVIMIMPYDPFGYDRMVYTVKNVITELPDAEYEDGARTIFLNTNGKLEIPNRELQELLRYMECTTEENACNETLRKIHRMVEVVKEDQEASLEYMKIFEREQMLIEQGRNEERKNTEKERQKAEKERQNAELERLNAEKERKRADGKELENQHLRAILKENGIDVSLSE